MGVVIIPFDYEQLPESERKTIVPICISSVDRHGNPIAAVWFEKGVVPVQEQLRGLARIRLGDVQRVSELAEITVHKLWERHGENAGIWPSRRVLVRAMWEARDLAAGNSPWRIKHTVSLAMDSLERDLYNNGIADPKRYEEIYHQQLLLDLVERRIAQEHRQEIREVFKMLRQGYSWDEIGQRLGDRKPEAIKKRFWRWMRHNFPTKSS
jgi:hypothetical protein